MANVIGSAYQKMYLDEVKQFVAGVHHTSPHYILDDVASANASDKVFFGKLPAGSRILSFKTLNGVAITLEDDSANALVAGDVVSAETVLVAVPAAGLTNDVILCEYLQD